MLRPGRIIVLAFTLLIAACAPAFAVPRVVVTIKPLHSLVAGVMAGLGEPELIIRGAGSPHTYNLKPSEARMLERAQVIFWVGGSLETFMEKPLAALGPRARIVEAMQVPGISLVPGRKGGPWDGHAGHEPAGSAENTGDQHEPAPENGAAHYDGHLWLDPANARILVRSAADALGQTDPANGSRYAANAERLVARIDALDAELRATLAPVRDIPFVVFHDAYQYLEKSYALRAVGSIAVSPERKPGAKRVKEMRDKIRSFGARCVFSEPQFTSAILDTLLEGTTTRAGTLDPLGADLPAGPEAYFSLMRALGTSLATCLGQR